MSFTRLNLCLKRSMQKMTHEKTLTLRTGRSVKVITQSTSLIDPQDIEIDVLIKEPSEANYRPPIGLTHPKYWKLKQMDAQKSRKLQIKYSGLTEKQVRIAIKEFRQKHN